MTDWIYEPEVDGGGMRALRLVNIFGNRRVKPSIEEWNADRHDNISSCRLVQEAGEGIPAKLSAMSWLSLACFVEDLDPAALGIKSVRAQELRQDTDKLREESDSFGVYVMAVEHLSRG